MHICEEATFYQIASRSHLHRCTCLCITVISYSQFKGHRCGGQSFPYEQASWRENNISGSWLECEENRRALWISGWELIDEVLSVECLQTGLISVKHRWLVFCDQTQNTRTWTSVNFIYIGKYINYFFIIYRRVKITLNCKTAWTA